MKNRLVCSSLILFLISSLACASELLMPASQIEKGKGSLLLGYTSTSRKLGLSQSGSAQIAVNGNSYFSESTTNFDIDTKASSYYLKYLFNHNNDIYYWFKAGRGKYELEIDSRTVTNKLSSSDYGWVGGAGIRKNLFPDTIVTPAIALEFGINIFESNINSFKSGAAPEQMVSNKLSVTDIQAAIILSKKYKLFEPYGSITVSRVETRITDNNSLAKIDGYKENAGLVIGTKIKFFEKDSLAIETSFINESSISASWNIDF